MLLDLFFKNITQMAAVNEGKDEREPAAAALAVANSILGAYDDPQMAVDGDVGNPNDLL